MIREHFPELQTFQSSQLTPVLIGWFSSTNQVSSLLVSYNKHCLAPRVVMRLLLIILLIIAIVTEAKRMNFDESNYGQMVGLRYLDTESEATASSLQRDKIVTREQLPLVHRVIPPGSMVTMDYRKERMNVHLDENDNVKKVKYG